MQWNKSHLAKKEKFGDHFSESLKIKLKLYITIYAYDMLLIYRINIFKVLKINN